MSKVHLIIKGEPVGKQRPKVSMKDGIIRTYTPEKTMKYESLIAHEYMKKYQKPSFGVDEPIKANVYIHFGLKKSDLGKNGPNKQGREKLEKGFATNPVDIDNVLKSVFDSLNAICYPDDKQIVEVHAYKWYSEEPMVEIVLESCYES